MFLVPLTRTSELARNFDRLFDDSFDRFFSASNGNDSTRSPALDVTESDRGYTVHMDLPGVAKEDVQVSIDGRRITVQAQARRSDEKRDDKKDGDRVVYRERSVASFARTFTLPLEVDQAESSAKLDNGVLTLALPKRGARTASQIAVN